MAIRRLNIEPIKDELLRGATVLVPNNRLRDIVTHGYAEFQKPVYLTPQVQSIDLWISEIWQKAAEQAIQPYNQIQALSSSEEIFIWIEIIEESLEQLPLLNPDETANAVSRAYQLLKQWRLDQDHMEVLESYKVIPDIDAFLDWSSKFEERCQSRSLASLADCLVQINQDLSSGLALPLAEEIVLVNFYQPPPLYAELFSLLSQQSKVVRHNYNYDSSAAPKFRFQFHTQKEEFDYVTAWAKQLIEAGQNLHIGVIGELDEKQRSDFHHALACKLDENHLLQFDNSQTWINTSHSGRNLTQEAVIHDAFLLLDLLRDEQVSENICRLLRSPFVLPTENEELQRQALERYMRRNLSDRCSSHEISRLAQAEGKDYFCPQLSTALLSIRELLRQSKKWDTPRNWAALFKTVLQEFHWPGEKLTSRQRANIKRWHEALNRLSSLNVITGKVDLAKALSCLRNLCVNSRQTQTFDARCQISQYSIEEAAGLEFDHIWILNLNDQVWPPAAKANPFLPFTLQKEQQLPASHSSLQYEMAASSFEMLINAASKEINISHHTSSGDQEFRASGFTANIELSELNATLLIAAQQSHSRNQQNEALMLLATDSTAVPLQTSSGSLGGHQVLGDQSSCPFRAFSLHRLDADPIEPFSSGLSKMARGSAIHRSLEYLYKSLHSKQQLAQLSEDEIDSLCDKSASEAIAFLSGRHGRLMTPRFRDIEHSRIKTLLRRFLTSQEAEPGRESFQVIGREEHHEWHYEDMQFNLVIDRLDQLADGSLAVIDYKTGKSTASNSSWLAERPEDLQLPFYYTVMVSQQPAPVSAVSIAHLNAANISYTGLAADSGFHSRIKPSADDRYVKLDWAQLATDFTSKVESFADQFKSGVANVDPANGTLTCRYCALESLCRIGELTESSSIDGELS